MGLKRSLSEEVVSPMPGMEHLATAPNDPKDTHSDMGRNTKKPRLDGISDHDNISTEKALPEAVPAWSPDVMEEEQVKTNRPNENNGGALGALEERNTHAAATLVELSSTVDAGEQQTQLDGKTSSDAPTSTTTSDPPTAHGIDDSANETESTPIIVDEQDQLATDIMDDPSKAPLTQMNYVELPAKPEVEPAEDSNVSSGPSMITKNLASVRLTDSSEDSSSIKTPAAILST
ncbi:hypothetical protein NX059_006209 [Plenodomus lindquistii]|nr:hypothetical protein NX059_006209 [Plenodomus lindquistii]